MGRTERIKGKNFEYRVVRMAREHGLQAKRIVLSGSAEEKLDIEVDGMRFECKYRTRGLTQLYDWLEKAKEQGGAGVVVGGLRKPPLVVIPAEIFFKLLKGEEK